jgi:hypothetical protein
MKGPYPLSHINAYVTKSLPGAYILSNDGRVAHYVGRSDNDVATRLRQHYNAREGYRYFWFEYAKSAVHSFYIECMWYHTYEPSDNENHPASPANTFARCPVPDCPYS